MFRELPKLATAAEGRHRGFNAFLVAVAVSALALVSCSGGGGHGASGASGSGTNTGTTHADLFVSTVGSDDWSGDLAEPNGSKTDGPFATVGRARDALRASPHSGPVTVAIRGGRYALSEPIVFSPADSGSASAPITYSAFQGEEPVLSGGQQITGWTRYDGNAVPQTQSGQIWVAQVPSLAQGSWRFRQLFVNDERRIRARTPNQGEYHRVNGATTPAPLPGAFGFRGSDIKPSWGGSNVEVVALQSWGEYRSVINAVVPIVNLVELTGFYGPAGLESNARYWVENTRDALDSPGEWYLDEGRGFVYYFAMPGEDVSQATVIAPVLAELVRLDGDAPSGQVVHDLAFVGLTFSHADWRLPGDFHVAQSAFDVPAAFTATGARSIRIEKSLFAHLGGWALELGRGSQGNQLVGNEMRDLGAGGVKIGDPQVPSTDASKTSGNEVTDNTIHDVGNVYPAASGAWIGQASDNTIAHNEIFDTYETAVSVGWTWGRGSTGAGGNLIQQNDLHDIGRGMLSDMGCVYALGIQPGTVIDNNRCHDVTRSSYGGWGIYLENGASEMQVTNNVVYATQDGGLLVSVNAEGNRVENNVFASNGGSQIWRVGPSLAQTFSFERNIVSWSDGELLHGPWQDGRQKFDDNLYHCFGACDASLSFATFYPVWQTLGQDPHSVLGDPKFVNAAADDFSLAAASPASKIGFLPIDLSGVGPRPGTQR